VSATPHPRSAGLTGPTPIRTRVRATIDQAWARAIASGTLPALPGEQPVAIEIDRPARPEYGDFSTNLAMKLARPYRKAPLEIASVLAAEIEAGRDLPDSPIASVGVAAPGFVNITIADHALEESIAAILKSPATWGRIEPVRERSVNVEFVSANPTGPLTIGNARGAFIGDLLSRILEAGGQRVTREYYFNDVGGHGLYNNNT